MGKRFITRMVLTLLFAWLSYFSFVCIGNIDAHKFASVVKQYAISEYKMEIASEAEKEAAKDAYTTEMDNYKAAFVDHGISQLRFKLVTLFNLLVFLVVIWWPSKKKQNKSEMATPMSASD